MRKRPFAYIACVFLTGLVYQRYRIKWLVILVGILILWEIYSGRKQKRLLKIAGRSLILLSAFLLGIFHMQSEVNFRDAYMSKVADGSRITVWGELIKTETTENKVRGVLSDCYISIGEEKIPCNHILVYASEDHFQTGQVYKITGKLNMFSKARNEGEFDSLVYYQSLKIDFAVQEEAWNVLGESTGVWKNGLFQLRRRVCEIYDVYMTQRAAGFYQAMILGDKTNLDQGLKNLFLLGGISHIIAISGLHVSILGRGVYKVLRKNGISFGIAGAIGGALVVLYCLMVGSSTSAIRAVGMLILYFLSQWMGRSYDMLNSLGVMAVLLLIENPFLIENTGFWFSITALLGVGIVGKELSFQGKGSKRVKLLSGIMMSLAITLTTLPVTAFSYYEIQIYSPLVNFVVLPLLTPIFVLAVIGGLIGAIFPGVSGLVLIFYPCQWILSMYEWICSFVAQLPGATWICGKPSVGQMVIYYVVLFVGIFVLKSVREQPAFVYVLSITILLISLIGTIGFRKDDFKIVFLDVGQGDGIFISSGDGVNCFIDGGSSNVNGVGEYRILPYLKANAVSEIDYWFVSHWDMDHISGLLELIEKGYKIKHIVLHEWCSIGEKEESTRRLIRENGTKIIYMDVGDAVFSKKMCMTCIGPDEAMETKAGEDKNDSSMVLMLEWQDNEKSKKSFKALFAGDISTGIEDILCKSGRLTEVDLCKASHHGSNYSNGTQLLEMIQPEYIVVSCAKKNSYGHPGEKAVQRMKDAGALILYTMNGGQTSIQIDKKGLVKISSFLLQ